MPTHVEITAAILNWIVSEYGPKELRRAGAESHAKDVIRRFIADRMGVYVRAAVLAELTKRGLTVDSEQRRSVYAAAQALPESDVNLMADGEWSLIENEAPGLRPAQRLTSEGKPTSELASDVSGLAQRVMDEVDRDIPALAADHILRLFDG